MNSTIFSFILSTYLSNAPFYMIQKRFNDQQTVSIINSYISYSISNFIFSNSVIYQTTIKQNSFSYFLKSPLNFINADEETEKPVVYKNQKFTERLEYKSTKKIIIAGGIFQSCISDDNGAGLLIQQNCAVLVHGVIFLKCETRKNGGGMYISSGIKNPSINDFNTNFQDDKLSHAEIQYCCFQHCQAWRNDDNIGVGFGAGAMIAGEKVNIYFVSSNNHLESGQQDLRSRGARIDIQATEIFAHYINGTESFAVTCAAFEFRSVSSGSIKYQTFQRNDCMFVESFTNVDMNNVDISDCNMAHNKIQKYGSISHDPGLVYIRDKSLEIKDYVITNTQIQDSGKLASKYGTISITLTRWKVWGFGDNPTGEFQLNDCKMMNSAVETIPFSHLNLGECGGNVSVAQLIITSLFSPSNDFTLTTGFTKSNDFSDSDDFSKSSLFPPTDKFTKTTEFTRTTEFTKTNVFSVSTVFTQSGKFSASDNLDRTSCFSPSKSFTKSDFFSSSFYFSKTTDFSSSNIFSSSKQFILSKTSIINSQINIDIHSDSNSKDSLGMKIGIGVVCGIAVLSLILIGVFLFNRRKKINFSVMDEETIEIAQDENDSVVVQNPLNNLVSDDDPFMDDFE